MTSLDVFIINVGLRSLGKDVGESSLSNLSWVLSAYTIVFAALMVPAGRLGDRFGNKGVFTIGLVLFTLASLGCALSSNVWLIVGLRSIQAIGGAALTPTSLGLILTTIPPERREFSIRIWAVTGSLGAVAGPALGGLLVSLSWRWIFVVNVPIGLVAVLLTMRNVPDVRHNRDARIPDLLGGALLIAAVGALALALVKGPSWGWGATSTIVSFAVATIGMVLFLIRSGRAAAPVVDFQLFKDSVFARATGAMFFTNVAFGLQLLGLILWLQEGWGWSALRTGLAIAPGPAMVSVGALGLRAPLAKFPQGTVAALGSLLIAGGSVLIGALLGTRPNYLDVLPGWMIFGFGVGLFLPRIIASGSANLPPHQTSTGSAVLQMGRYIGIAIGVSVLVIVLGSPTLLGATLDSFRHACYWAAAPALIGSVMALGLTPKPAPTGSATPQSAGAATPPPTTDGRPLAALPTRPPTE